MKFIETKYSKKVTILENNWNFIKQGIITDYIEGNDIIDIKEQIRFLIETMKNDNPYVGLYDFEVYLEWGDASFEMYREKYTFKYYDDFVDFKKEYTFTLENEI